MTTVLFVEMVIEQTIWKSYENNLIMYRHHGHFSLRYGWIIFFLVLHSIFARCFGVIQFLSQVTRVSIFFFSLWPTTNCTPVCALDSICQIDSHTKAARTLQCMEPTFGYFGNSAYKSQDARILIIDSPNETRPSPRYTQLVKTTHTTRIRFQRSLLARNVTGSAERVPKWGGLKTNL